MHKITVSLDTSDCIMVLENFVQKDECDLIIKQAEDWLKTEIVHAGQVTENTSNRQDVQLSIPTGFVPSFHFYTWTQEMCLYATSLYGGTVHSAVAISPLSRVCKWQKTEKNQKGFSNWHVEQFIAEAADRCLVWMLYLNDVEAGGSTEFLYQGISVKPEAGRFVLWPAGVTHPHRGNPPYSNTKYILTGWLEMPNNYEFLISRGIYERMMNENYNDIQLFKLPETVIKKMEKE